MIKELNETITAMCAASSNIIAAVDKIGVDNSEIIGLEYVVKYIHEQSTIIHNYLDKNILSHINVVDTEYEINGDFIRSIEYTKYATRNYDAFLLCCNYSDLSPIELIREFADDLRENPVLSSEIQTTANEL